MSTVSKRIGPAFHIDTAPRIPFLVTNNICRNIIIHRIISTEEVEAVVKHLRHKGEPDYNMAVTEITKATFLGLLSFFPLLDKMDTPDQ